MVYDPSKEESVACLAEYMADVKENATLGDDTPLVLLGVTSAKTQFKPGKDFAAELIEELLIDFNLEESAHLFVDEHLSAQSVFEKLSQ